MEHSHGRVFLFMYNPSFVYYKPEIDKDIMCQQLECSALGIMGGSLGVALNVL
jgi:hypothetical protein